MNSFEQNEQWQTQNLKFSINQMNVEVQGKVAIKSDYARY
jgi:hypothetical protein